MELHSDFTPDTPPMLDRDAKEVSKILDALQDYVYKVGEHLSKVAIGVECTGDADVKDASCNAITCRQCLPLFRSVHSAKGFNVAGQHFQNILGSISFLPEQIKRHLKYCTIGTHSYWERRSVFENNITRMKEISQTPAMYNEPYFLPAYSSTPNSNMSAREQRSPITPISKYGQNRSIPARTNLYLFGDISGQETHEYMPSVSRSNHKTPSLASKTS